jgi:hypothetical protein
MWRKETNFELKEDNIKMYIKDIIYESLVG